MNLKAGHKSEQRHLEAEFRVKQMHNFFLPNFFLNFFDFEFVSKSYSRLTEPPPSYGFEGATPTLIENWVKQ
jgi:hypothetical protein